MRDKEAVHVNTERCARGYEAVHVDTRQCARGQPGDECAYEAVRVDSKAVHMDTERGMWI